MQPPSIEYYTEEVIFFVKHPAIPVVSPTTYISELLPKIFAAYIEYPDDKLQLALRDLLIERYHQQIGGRIDQLQGQVRQDLSERQPEQLEQLRNALLEFDRGMNLEKRPIIDANLIKELATTEIKFLDRNNRDEWTNERPRVICYVAKLTLEGRPLNDEQLSAYVTLVNIAFDAIKGGVDTPYNETIDRNLQELLDYLKRTLDHGGTIIQRIGLTPNWYVTTTALGDGTQTGGGGPAAKPIPVDKKLAAAINTWSGLRDRNSNSDYGYAGSELKARLESKALEKEIDIAVLDAFPSLCDLQAAKAFWGDSTLPNYNVLLANLLENVVPLQRGDTAALATYQSNRLLMAYAADMQYPSQDERLLNPHTPTVQGFHQYGMTDHGLFVASLVKSICPESQLICIQVLNDNGVGSILTFINGLERLQEFRAKTSRPMIINMSFMVNLPTDVFHLYYDLPAIPRLFLYFLNASYIGMMDEFSNDIMELTTSGLMGDITKANYISENHVVAVAAAGNDGSIGLPSHPPTRRPASFEAVVGVGAIKRSLQAGPQYTSYSNIADEPNSTGLLAFGGDVHDPFAPLAERMTHPDDGIVGVYIGKFPSTTYTPNETGYARWAGTSFATPIASGVIAKLMQMGLSPDEIRNALIDAYAENPPESHVIPINQP